LFWQLKDNALKYVVVTATEIRKQFLLNNFCRLNLEEKRKSWIIETKQKLLNALPTEYILTNMVK
jgi:hypothetical protein